MITCNYCGRTCQPQEDLCMGCGSPVCVSVDDQGADDKAALLAAWLGCRPSTIAPYQGAYYCQGRRYRVVGPPASYWARFALLALWPLSLPWWPAAMLEISAGHSSAGHVLIYEEGP